MIYLKNRQRENKFDLFLIGFKFFLGFFRILGIYYGDFYLVYDNFFMCLYRFIDQGWGYVLLIMFLRLNCMIQ